MGNPPRIVRVVAPLKFAVAKQRVAAILVEKYRVFYPNGSMAFEFDGDKPYTVFVDQFADRIVRNVVEVIQEGEDAKEERD